jgi:hypothetical protein
MSLPLTSLWGATAWIVSSVLLLTSASADGVPSSVPAALRKLVLLLMRLLPGRLVIKYWQLMPRESQREHDGFSLGHLTLDVAQAWQLSRSLVPEGAVLRPELLRRVPLPLLLAADDAEAGAAVAHDAVVLEWRLGMAANRKAGTRQGVQCQWSGLVCTAPATMGAESGDNDLIPSVQRCARRRWQTLCVVRGLLTLTGDRLTCPRRAGPHIVVACSCCLLSA